MDEIIRIDTVDQYNKLYGLETLHPLVGVVAFDQSYYTVDHLRINMGIYSLFLK